MSETLTLTVLHNTSLPGGQSLCDQFTCLLIKSITLLSEINGYLLQLQGQCSPAVFPSVGSRVTECWSAFSLCSIILSDGEFIRGLDILLLSKGLGKCLHVWDWNAVLEMPSNWRVGRNVFKYLFQLITCFYTSSLPSRYVRVLSAVFPLSWHLATCSFGESGRRPVTVPGNDDLRKAKRSIILSNCRHREQEEIWTFRF